MFNLFKKKTAQQAPPSADVRFEAFKEHWKHIRRVLETTGPWSTGKCSAGDFHFLENFFFLLFSKVIFVSNSIDWLSYSPNGRSFVVFETFLCF